MPQTEIHSSDVHAEITEITHSCCAEVSVWVCVYTYVYVWTQVCVCVCVKTSL
jgi:hypothetical protein